MLRKPPEMEIGKYSYGPLTEQSALVKKIGAFCSFAVGSVVVPNHPMNYISTHDFLYLGNRIWQKESIPPLTYDDLRTMNLPWFFDGITPRGILEGERRITIGNDVWLGRNVVITNYANIGDGVIAGANTVITKDVPDYAIVVGAPARILRYRYTPQQIKSLKEIAWWNWSDDKIREYYDDFYLGVDEFIRRHR